MKKLLLFALLLPMATVALADKPSGVWRFARAATMKTTAWKHPGPLIDLGDRQICHYVGRIVFPPDHSGRCADVLVLHLVEARAVEKGDSVAGLHCAYDWAYPDVDGHFLSSEVLRENCPDILATRNGGFEVIGEYWFKPMENQTVYYEDGAPLRQHLSNAVDVLNRFDKRYENQIRCRDTYNWYRLKPRDWDTWERPGSVYQIKLKEETMRPREETGTYEFHPVKKSALGPD